MTDILEKIILHKIINVRPTDSMISLTWMIGSRCNYDCMYCPTELHDNVSAHADLEKLKTAWHSMHEKTSDLGLPYKISFTGGEVTANKSFLPLIEYLQSGKFNIGQLLVTTNGSASQNYYRRLSQIVDCISFSTHSEFFNEKDFCNGKKKEFLIKSNNFYENNVFSIKNLKKEFFFKQHEELLNEIISLKTFKK